MPFERAGLPAMMTVYRNEGRWEVSRHASTAPGSRGDEKHPSEPRQLTCASSTTGFRHYLPHTGGPRSVSEQ